MNADYGPLGLTRNADGSVVVGETPPLIAISFKLLQDGGAFDFDERTGDLTIAGQVKYRPVRVDGPFLVCGFLHRVAS